MFRHATTVRLYDTDATGALFFAQQFRLAHEACEAFMAAAGFVLPMKPLKAGILLPIVHAEADYTAPLNWGDQVTVEVQPGRVGTTSFVLKYRFCKAGDTLAGTAQTVHVAVSRKTGRPVHLPDALRAVLTASGRRKA